MPPNMKILLSGLLMVLGLVVVVAGAAGLVTSNPLVALNGAGFIGICALSAAVVFYAIAIERIGLKTARRAAVTLVMVLGGSAFLMTVLFFVLIGQARFRDEASRFGFHSAAGIAVLIVLAASLAVMWHDR